MTRRHAAIALALLAAGLAFSGVWRSGTLPAAPNVVNDGTGLNPVTVARVLAPTSTEEIAQAVRSHAGPISIGGGRYSMGGQTATEGSLHLDLRRFNRILAFSPAARTITVQAGATWRQILEHIDPHNLSPRIMQTYANFTVGGSLSVNVHGRYMGLGPLILSVRSIRIVLADGRVVDASPVKNRDIFYGAIGGYGGLGVIVEAAFELADNVKVRRDNRVMPVAAYKDYFFRNMRGSTAALLHNADLYPGDYDTVNAVTYTVTDEPVTVPERLVPAGDTYRTWHFLGWVVADWPGGKWIRRHVIDPLLFSGTSVQWRNHEASYDVAELPVSTPGHAYVLQEYFVPVERFDEFVPKLRAILQRHEVNTINISIRHASADPGSLLAWAPREVFAFVHYYQQQTGAEARARVGVWTRELIDAALSVNGTYYLPYQPHATPGQFRRAYPRAGEFFRLKQRLDPANKFRNKLWDKYYEPAAHVHPGHAQTACSGTSDIQLLTLATGAVSRG
jgi:FAD/FMN-containing dehydrogenase